jgi:MoaA/NifB/PqqE/SkfB family radical SAM enzyme
MTDKTSIGNLIIETTRRCNASCDHCLRGDARNKDIKREVIEALLDKVDYIGSVTFTGGEPSLNPKAITDFVDICKEKGVSVSNFYMATNGVEYTDDFLLAIMKLYLFCDNDEPEITQLEVSRSYYHDCFQNEDEIDKLRCFSFFSERKYLKYSAQSLIDQGRAKDYGLGARKNLVENLEIVCDNIEGEFYLNVNGDVIEGCDWSYKSQSRHKKGNVLTCNSLSEIIPQSTE